MKLPQGSHNLISMIGLGILLSAAAMSQAQSYDSCQGFSKDDLHAKIDCLEAWFSASPAHLTFSSLPPGNGIAIGGVLEQNNHYVSPFAPPGTPRIAPGKSVPAGMDASTDNVPSLGSLWSADGRIATVFSTNGSWLATGTLTVMPKGYVPGHREDHNGAEVSCNKLGPLCTRQVFGMHLEATHRSLKTLSFYGIGPESPAVKYIFPQNETYGSFRASLPLEDWFAVESGFEYRQTDLPLSTAFNSVSANFNNSTAPGLTSQPGFAHPYVAIRTDPIAYLSPKTDDKDENRQGPDLTPFFVRFGV